LAEKQILRIANVGGNDADRAETERALKGQDARYRVTGLEIIGNFSSCWPVLLFPNLSWVGLASRQIMKIDELRELPQLRSLSLMLMPQMNAGLLPFLNLTRLYVGIKNPSHAEVIAQCSSLEFLELGLWPFANLGVLRPLRLDVLRLRSRGLDELDGIDCTRLRHLDCLGCAQLRSFAGLDSRLLNIFGCRKVDNSTIPQVGRLQWLALRSQPRILDLSFIRGCACLEKLEIAATRIGTEDFSPIENSSTLKEVWLSFVKDKTIRRISEANSRLFVTNGRIFVRGGIECPEDWPQTSELGVSSSEFSRQYIDWENGNRRE
jgi:hypothetical protein